MASTRTPRPVSLEALKSGTVWDAEEVERMRASRVFRLKLEHAWCGRVRPTTKLRLTWHLCFGPNGREHTIEVLASMRSGKREVRFDRHVLKAAARCAPLLFQFEVPGHELVLEEAIERGPESSNNNFRFALRVDGVRFNELADVDGVTAAEAERLEKKLEKEITKVRRKLAEETPEVPPDNVSETSEAKSSPAQPQEVLSRRSVVAENALVALYQVQLEPGVFGTGILLRNEPCASRRIEVAAVASKTGVPGVVPGDVLVAINGKPLPRGASATELQELVRSNPRYALTAVDALMWHKKLIDRAPDDEPDDDDLPDVEGLAGSELTINCGNGALGVEWARMVSTPNVPAAHVDGLFAAVGIRGQALHLAVKTGDCLIGINHEPLPKDLPSATLLQRFSSAAARGPPTLNLWRCYDPKVLTLILHQCEAAKKHALAVNPSVSAHIPRKPRDLRPPPAACC